MSPQLRGIESRLAAMGLRPTASELAGGGVSTVLPLIFLMIIGAVKLVIGLSREKPILFLFIALMLTFLATLVVVSSRGRLTPTGKRTLNSLRGGYSADPSANPDPIAMSMGVALLGPAILGEYSGLFDGDVGFKDELSQLGTVHGGGSSSGCSGGDSSGGGGDGGSGCSSGCGGCGGGD